MRAAVLALLAVLGTARQGDPWAQLWTELETLRAGSAPAAEAAVLREHLVAASREGPDDARVLLLRASLEALEGRDVRGLASHLAALDPSPFGPRERWFLADLMPPGRERADALLSALEAPTTLARWQVLLAWNVAVDEARALRHAETTLPIQRLLHERYLAEWSALDLTLTYKALGDHEAAERVLADTIAREETAGRRPSRLWESRGILALGFGDERKARDYLGKALALGSNDAGLLLSRLDLMQGRTDSARRGFRALILDDPPPDWAWRGWGTALLPPAFAGPVARHVPNE